MSEHCTCEACVFEYETWWAENRVSDLTIRMPMIEAWPRGVPLRCPRCFDLLGPGGETTPAWAVNVYIADEQIYVDRWPSIPGSYCLIPVQPEEVPE